MVGLDPDLTKISGSDRSQIRSADYNVNNSDLLYCNYKKIQCTVQCHKSHPMFQYGKIFLFMNKEKPLYQFRDMTTNSVLFTRT